MNLGLAAKEKPAGLRRRAFNQFSRGVSYEVRDWYDGTADPLTKAESWFSFSRSGTLESPGGRCRCPALPEGSRSYRTRCRETANLSADTALSVVAPVGSGCWIVGPIAL